LILDEHGPIVSNNDAVVKIKKKSKTRGASPKATQPSAKELQTQGSGNSELTCFALMRRLKRVRSSGPYTRDQLNER
jgi:hypothetical protein